MIRIQRYTSDKKDKWDSFVKVSKNNVFLFERNFMDYHKNRFTDYSLMVYDKKDTLIALLPANLKEGILYSHQGLTYGGLILALDVKLQTVIDIFQYILKYLHENSIKYIYYKKTPNLYNSYNTEEDEYVFFRVNSEIYRIDTSITVDYNNVLPFQKRRLREIKKARKNNLKLSYNDSFDVYWNQILSPNLLNRFNKKPVHSLKEINYLKSLFDKNIIQINVLDEKDNILAGTTLFIVNKVVHAQYISTNEQGKKFGAIDYLFSEIIDYYSDYYKFFDFGICNEDDGKYINKGLLDWKEGFGARTFIHKFFKIDTSKHDLLND